ncbi:hypothetical protein MesoLjLc_56070 [Mesorhizobium sp. L-8-10]|nr:hypothetical protein MesoLjLc_56070 [Mesorhizobium sp. L-8-10]
MTAQMQGSLDVRRLCALAGVSRAGFYRYRQEQAPARADAELRDMIQKLSLKHRHYGYRRIAAQLHRDGVPVNAKRVLRLMREDNLLCMRTRPYVPRTTDSRHGYRILPNLVRGLVPPASIRSGSPTSLMSAWSRPSSISPSSSMPSRAG